MTSVAEVKAAIDAAMLHVQEGQEAVRSASDKLGEARHTLAAAVQGSGHEAVTCAQAALSQAASELDECLSATRNAVDQAQSYMATL